MRKNCLDYPVEVVENVFAEENAALAKMLQKATGADKPRVVLVTDQNIVAHTEGLGSRIGRWMKAHNVELVDAPLIVMGGERAKGGDLACVSEIVRLLIKAKVGSKDIVLALGGGSILDATCWAAAQVRGGVPVLRIPTTPAAMVDGAFADYAAIDASGVKDALRIACRPAGVIIDPAFTATILDGVWRAGFAEAMRIAVALDAALVKKLVKLLPKFRERDAEAMKEMVEATVATRMKKGGTDFALWSAHRLEAVSGYKLPHGYAVALGICIDMNYAVLKGAMKEGDRQTISDAISACGAMEGAMHSRHLLGNGETVLRGLDAWRLSHGSEAITIPTGIGKSEVEENPDRDTMKQAINMLK